MYLGIDSTSVSGATDAFGKSLSSSPGGRVAWSRLSTLLICVCLVLQSTGCITTRSKADSYRLELSAGMSKSDVQDLLGKPERSFPVPGQGGDLRLPVEIWRYMYRWTAGGVVLTFVLFPFGMFFSDTRPHGFDVGFDAKGQVLRVSEVVRFNKKGEPEETDGDRR